MSNDFPLPKISIIKLVSISIKDFITNFVSNYLKPISLFLLIFISFDLIVFFLNKIFSYRLYEYLQILQWITKSFTIFLFSWLIVLTVKNSTNPFNLNFIINETKNNLKRVLLTYVSVIVRFLGLVLLNFVVGIIAALSEDPQIAAIFVIVFSIPISIYAIYLMVHFVFVVYLIFDQNLKPFDIPTESKEISIGFGWKIFFTMILLMILLAILVIPIYAVFSNFLSFERLQSMVSLSGNIFKTNFIFTLLIYIVYGVFISLQTKIFYDFYQKISD